MEALLKKQKKYGECFCGGTIVLDSIHKEFICLKCGRVFNRPGKRGDLKIESAVFIKCVQCKKKTWIVKYEGLKFASCPRCGHKYRL